MVAPCARDAQFAKADSVIKPRDMSNNGDLTHVDPTMDEKTFSKSSRINGSEGLFRTEARFDEPVKPEIRKCPMSRFAVLHLLRP